MAGSTVRSARGTASGRSCSAMWLRSGAVRAGLDDRIVAEYEDVLGRPEFGLPKHEVRIVLRQIQSLAEYAEVLPCHIMKGIPDPDDAPFAECALALDCCLVTGNLRHFPRKAVGSVKVITSRQFVDRLS